MSDDSPKEATPDKDLERQITSSMVPKNEREHWAAREIDRLKAELAAAREQHKKDDNRIMGMDALIMDQARELAKLRALCARQDAIIRSVVSTNGRAFDYDEAKKCIEENAHE